MNDLQITTIALIVIGILVLAVNTPITLYFFRHRKSPDDVAFLWFPSITIALLVTLIATIAALNLR